jgi:putative ABC transport system permease protein
VARPDGGRRHGWWAMSARLFGRSLGRRGATFFVALVAITGGSAVAAAMLTLKADLRAKMTRELRRYGENMALVPLDPGATLDEAELRSVLGLEVSPVLLARGEVGRDARRAEPAPVVGVDFAAHRRLHPFWRVDGAWPSGDDDALVGAALAARLAIEPGAHVLLRLESGGEPSSLRVAGLVRTGEAEEEQVFMPLRLLQARTGLPGRVSLATLFVPDNPGGLALNASVKQLEGQFFRVQARPLRPIAAAQGAILDRLDRMTLFMTAVILALAALCLGTTLFTLVVEREAEIGLMRSLGADDGDVARVVLGEVTLLGLAGGALGLLLGALAARLIGWRLFDAAIDLRLAVVPMVLGIALGVSWLAVLVPLRRALRIRPAMALRAE